MKAIKLTVLFKSGIEKIYYIYNQDNNDIEEIKNLFVKYVGNKEIQGNVSFSYSSIIIAPTEIASVEIEVLD